MGGETTFVKDYYFHSADDTYVEETEKKPDPISDKVLTSYEYERPAHMPKPLEFNRDDNPLEFRTTPESLLNLAIKVVEEIPLPSVYTWTTEQVCCWLRGYGYPQYLEAIRVNLINGRTLLLLNASALPAMNIKDFDHIRHITYGIRCLFHFEMTKFGRSITLAPEYHIELYKLLRVKNGTKYERSKASELWRRLQIIRPNKAYREHWEILGRWLRFEPEVIERVGGIHRHQLYKCKIKKADVDEVTEPKLCHCMPPCECYWTERHTQIPLELNLISKEISEEDLGDLGDLKILSVLVRDFPERYKDKKNQESYFNEFERW